MIIVASTGLCGTRSTIRWLADRGFDAFHEPDPEFVEETWRCLRGDLPPYQLYSEWYSSRARGAGVASDP